MSRPVDLAGRASRLAIAKILVGLLVLFLLVYGSSIYGAMTASGRLSPDLRGVGGPVDVVVTVPFEAARFHVDKISEYGVYGGRGPDGEIRLRNVTPSSLASLSRVPWIESIEAFP